MVKGNRGFLGLVAIGNQSANNVDQAIDRRAVTGMLDLGNVFQLVNNGFDDGAFPQQQAVCQGHQAIFHIALEFGKYLGANKWQTHNPTDLL